MRSQPGSEAARRGLPRPSGVHTSVLTLEPYLMSDLIKANEQFDSIAVVSMVWPRQSVASRCTESIRDCSRGSRSLSKMAKATSSLAVDTARNSGVCRSISFLHLNRHGGQQRMMPMRASWLSWSFVSDLRMAWWNGAFSS